MNRKPEWPAVHAVAQQVLDETIPILGQRVHPLRGLSASGKEVDNSAGDRSFSSVGELSSTGAPGTYGGGGPAGLVVAFPFGPSAEGPAWAD